MMPSQGNKNSLVQPSKSHTFLRKRTNKSPSSIKTVHTSVPVEVGTSQSTNSLSFRNNDQFNVESNPPDKTSREFVPLSEGEEDIFDDDRSPEEKAFVESCAIKRKGWDPDASTHDDNLSIKSRAESIASSTPSLERSIKKKKVQLESTDSRNSDDQYETTNSNQQVVNRNGQPTATPILIYEDTRKEVVQQCIANLISTFHDYPHSEVIEDSFTCRFQEMLTWRYPSVKVKRGNCKR